MPLNRLLPATLAALLLSLLPARAPASETWHTCVGFIDSLPATITTQGVWCLRADLSTAITSGNAISIQANNVTLDCNGHVVANTQPDPGNAVGIGGMHLNTTVRHCDVRRFRLGVRLIGGGQLVEDNAVRGSRRIGISVAAAPNSVVRRNLVVDTAAPEDEVLVFGIYVDGGVDVVDNEVNGVWITASDGGERYGIHADAAQGALIRGNRVISVSPAPSGLVRGIVAPAGGRVDGNYVAAWEPLEGIGIVGKGPAQTFCGNNLVKGFEFGFATCRDIGGNASRL